MLASRPDDGIASLDDGIAASATLRDGVEGCLAVHGEDGDISFILHLGAHA